jgi:hypothetical protein
LRLSQAAATHDIVVAKLVQILAYTRQGTRQMLKRKKEPGSAATLATVLPVVKPPPPKPVDPTANDFEYVLLFSNSGNFSTLIVRVFLLAVSLEAATTTVMGMMVGAQRRLLPRLNRWPHLRSRRPRATHTLACRTRTSVFFFLLLLLLFFIF